MEQERRLIDGNEALSKFPIGYPGSYTTFEIRKMLQSCTVVDAVLVVRCGECKHFNTDECAMMGYCDGCDCKVDLGFDETGYCSHGERKTPPAE